MKFHALLLVLLTPALAAAGAWTRPAGEIFVATSLRGYSTMLSERDTPFHRVSTDIHVAYGAREGLTVGGEAEIAQRSDLRVETRALIFLRGRVWTGATGAVASVEAAAGAPLTRRLTPLDLTPDQTKEASATARFGLPLDIGLGPGWADAALTLRHRAGPPADELKLDLTLGARPFERWLAMAQVFVTLGMRNNGFTGPNHDVAKLSLTLGRDLDERRTALIGVAADVWGRRVTRGIEVKATLWTRF